MRASQDIPTADLAPTAQPLDRALSVRQLARYWAVSPRKVRALIRRRLLRAIDIGIGVGRSQIRITPEAVAECERRLEVKAPPARRRRTPEVDSEIAAMLEP